MSIKMTPRGGCSIPKLEGATTVEVAEQLAALFVTKFKPSYEDEACDAITEALNDLVSSGATVTDTDLNNPVVQALVFAQANKSLEWDER